MKIKNKTYKTEYAGPGGVVYRQKRGEEAPNLSTVRGAPQNGGGPAEADVALMRLMALLIQKISEQPFCNHDSKSSLGV